jgi:hypothetical protein
MAFLSGIVNRVRRVSSQTLKIIPFTGFLELYDKIPPDFRSDPFPEIPDKTGRNNENYRDIFKWVISSLK